MGGISWAVYHWLDSRREFVEKKRGNVETFPLWSGKFRGIGSVSAGNDGRDDYGFGFFVVLRKFDFNTALAELTSG
jgi:hypothetical protein